MKFLKENWLIILVVIALFFGFNIYSNIQKDGYDSKHKESQEMISIFQAEVSKLNEKLALMKKEKNKVEDQKFEILKEIGIKEELIRELKKNLKKKPSVKIEVVEKFNTIEVEKIVYVKKDDCLELQNTFNKYINLDLSLKGVVDEILETGEIKDDGKDKIIETQKKENARLWKKLKGWNLSYGIGATIGYPSSSVGFTISYSKIIK